MYWEILFIETKREPTKKKIENAVTLLRTEKNIFKRIGLLLNRDTFCPAFCFRESQGNIPEH